MELPSELIAGCAAAVLVACNIAYSEDRCADLAAGSPPENTAVVSSKTVPAGSESGLPSFCEVQATIAPVEGSRIGAIYRLPANWISKEYCAPGWVKYTRDLGRSKSRQRRPSLSPL